MAKPTTARIAASMLLGALYLFSPWQVSSAVDKNTNERRAQVRTAYLFNIAKFATFPGTSTLNICIAADSIIQNYAAELNGRTLGDDRRIAVLINPQATETCHLAYIDSESTNTWRPQYVLTVSELEYSDGATSVIQFFEDGGKVRFTINLQHLDNATYSLSSKLVRLARNKK